MDTRKDENELHLLGGFNRIQTGLCPGSTGSVYKQASGQ